MSDFFPFSECCSSCDNLDYDSWGCHCMIIGVSTDFFDDDGICRYYEKACNVVSEESYN